MLSAVLRVDGPVSEAAADAIGPEAGREIPRTSVKVSRGEAGTVIEVAASDASAMRAALNSYLECIKVIEDVQRLAEVRR
jgi:KEOPS complex subunit Pcc1